MNATFNINTEKNGIELSFCDKPAEAVLSELKSAGFRWHRSRKVWYARQTAERLELAQRLAQQGADKAEDVLPACKKQGMKKPATINLDGLEKNQKTECGASFAAVLRADLKARGVTGVTIRARKSTYTDGITATIKTTAEDYRSAEEAAARDGWETFFRAQRYGVTVDGISYHNAHEGSETETARYIGCGSAYDDTSADSNFPVLRSFWRDRITRLDSINHHHMERSDYPEFTAAAYDRIAAIVQIIQSYNWDHSDSMTDYFDVGFYLDVDIKKPADFQPREHMTEAEREQMEADFAAEEAAEAERLAAWEQEQEERRKAAALLAEQERKDCAEIAAAVSVEDLPESQQYYICNLLGGIGKESNIDELKERADRPEDAFITRRVTFNSAAALEKFGKLLLHDFDFLAGKGGTGTNDPRITADNIHKLNTEQREAVKFYSVDCVAVYYGGELQMVINPEGYGYARYAYLPTAETIEETPTASAERTADEEAAQAEPFYFPAPVTEQAAGLEIGSTVTVYQTDSVLSNIVQTISGTLTAAQPGNYAQYSGVFLTVQQGRKQARIFCDDGKKTVVFEGEALQIPESVVYSSIEKGPAATWKHYRDNGEQIKMIIALYAGFGRVPVFDTVQR